MHRVTLHAGREKSLRLKHPWVFSGAIATVDGAPGSGETVELHAADGQFLATAAWSPSSAIRARVWSFDEREAIDDAFIAGRVRASVAARAPMFDAAHTGCRLVHAESDGLPGVIADRYGEVVVVQLHNAGAEAWRDSIVASLVDATGCSAVYERSDAEVRSLEGLPPRTGTAYGVLPQRVSFLEDRLSYGVDVAAGQKTGFFLDQRENRRRIRGLAMGRDVLDCFCYTGGFTVAALAGGAQSVLAIDSSAEALAQARDNVARNGLDDTRCAWRDADVFAELRKLRDSARSFDLIVLDPPKFAPTARHMEKAARAYKDINLLALKLLRPGGLLATFSCSGSLDLPAFMGMLFLSARRAGREIRLLAVLGAGPDHPQRPDFARSRYLKGALLAVD